MRDWVVELVGLEPTTRMLWNAGLSDQLTLSNTRYQAGLMRHDDDSSTSHRWRFLPDIREYLLTQGFDLVAAT